MGIETVWQEEATDPCTEMGMNQHPDPNPLEPQGNSDLHANWAVLISGAAEVGTWGLEKNSMG